METEIDESRILSGEYTAKTYKAGSVFPYTIVFPKHPAPKEETALLVSHDGLVREDVYAHDALREEGRTPACVILAVSPATLPATLPDRTARNMRLDDYDLFEPGYADFIVRELIPHLRALYGEKLSISDAPICTPFAAGPRAAFPRFALRGFTRNFSAASI